MPRLSQSSIKRQQYIPQHVQQAMNQHMQSTMPAHLQRYMGSGGNVPTHAQKAINEHMQKTMPAHLKQYSGAYMEQSVLNSGPTAAATPASTVKPRPPVPNLLRQDHSNVSSEQFEARFHNNLFASDQSQPTEPAGQPQTVAPQQDGAPQTGAQSSSYEFITNPPKPPRRSLLPSLPTGASPLIRLGIVLGGLLILFILFAIIKGLFSNSNAPALISVAQDQQEIIHLATNATQQQGQSQGQAALSADTQTFVITAQTSLTSAQGQLLTYLRDNGKKVKAKTLNLKVSKSLDEQLTTAASSSSYDQTFKKAMQDELLLYEKDLKQAYSQTKGPKGRALLSEQYNGAQLLLQQLNSPAS